MPIDFLIIGAGIAGASLGSELARHGSVTVLEQEPQPGYHSTGRSAALFSETYGTPAIRALTRASRPFLEAPPSGPDEHPVLTPRGVMHVALQGQEAMLEDTFVAARKGSPDAALLTAHDTVARCPVLREDLVIGAVYEPGAMDIDVHALHQRYLKALRAADGVVQTNACLRTAAREGEHWTVELENGRRLQARRLVNAAGAWADTVARACGVPPIGLQPKRRTAFTFDAPANTPFADWPAIIGIDESYYFKPDAGQLLGSPANADPVEPHDVQPEELDVATGIYHIEQATTLHIRRPRHTWAGLRSFVADGDLVIGPDNHQPGFFWLAAQGGYGIQSAAGAAQLAASQLLGQALPDMLAREGVIADMLSPARLR